MSGGHACPVPWMNGLHEASTTSRPANVVEAYGCDGVYASTCAASNIGGLTAPSTIFNAVLPWTHSFTDEADFLSPYHAILTAQSQRFEVLFSADVEAHIPIELDALGCHGRERSNFPTSNSSDAVKSCFRVQQAETNQPRRKSEQNTSRVSFVPEVSLYLGSEQELRMCRTSILHHTLVNWSDKPWQLWNINKEGVWVRCAPPSEQAVLSSTHSPQIIYLQSLIPQLPVETCRITDFHGQVEGLDRIVSDEDANRRADADNEQPVEIPTFLRHLFDMALTAGELTDDDDLLIHVRTWHIHHDEHPQGKFPRVVELNREWHRWHREILSSWPDRVVAQEPHNIHVVQPEPHRHPSFQHCIADLIIVTGNEDGRYAGLTTVSPLIPNDGPLYSIAASFPAEVSGIMIRSAAEADHTCERRRCNIYHGWNEIPQTFERVHRMSQGDSLVIYLTRSEGIPDAAVSEHTSERELDATPEDMDQEDALNDESAMQVNESASPSADYHTRAYPDELQTAKLYRLNHPTVQARVRWRSFNNLLLDVARSLGVPIAQITSLHHIRVTPVGENDNEASIIVQMVNDVPDGSSDKLILLDIEMHQYTETGHYPRTPLVSRQVKKVVLHMARPHILMLGDVFQLCRDLEDRCLVHHDHVLWSQHDLAVRTFGHGHYLRVTVPHIIPRPAAAQAATEEVETGPFQGRQEVHDGHTQSSPPARDEGYSPSILDEGENNHSAGSARTTHDMLSDCFHAMQRPLALTVEQPEGLRNDSSSQEDIPPDWFLDLQILVQQYADRCDTQAPGQEEFLFSVYTWHLDHISNQLCREPKIAILGGNPAEWEEDILQPWVHRLIPGEAAFIDLVKPHSPRADIEEHIAHLIITQRVTTLSSALLAMEFPDDHARSVIVRFAIAVPRSCQTEDITAVVPFFARFVDRRMTWIHPVREHHDQSFVTRNGMCIMLRIFPEDLQDATVLLQSGAKRETSFRTMHAIPIGDASEFQVAQCKPSPNNDVIDIPMMLPPHMPMRSLRPRHDGDFRWFDELASHFDSSGIHEHINGVVFLHVTTWYVHHRRHPSCVSPRPVRLEGQAITWIEDFKHAWRDLLDDSIVLSIHVVRPRPTELRGRPVACHVLLEQARPENRCAGLLTGLIEGQGQNGWMQGAFSVPNPLSFQYAARTIGIWQYCQGAQCTFRIDTRALSLTEPEPLESGFHLHLRAVRGSQPAVPDLEQQFDDMSMMQQPVASHQIQTGTGDAVVETECPPQGLDVNAPAFHPGNPPIEYQTEFIQDLHACWSRHAFSWQTESPSATVHTWFVDHREPFPLCTQSREVQLDHAFQHWEQLIRGRWRDVLDHRLPLEFHVVSPPPPQLENGVAAHVILIQAQVEDWVSNLVSVEDDIMTALNDGQLMRLVITTHEHILLEHVVQTCGYDPACIWGTRPIQCRAWIQSRELLPGHRWPGRSGSSIHLRIRRQTNAQANQRPGLNLLQMGMQLNQQGPQAYRTLLLQAQTSVSLAHEPRVTASVARSDHFKKGIGRVARIVTHESFTLPTFLEVPVDVCSHQMIQAVNSWVSSQQVLDWHWLEDIDVMFASNNWLPHDGWHTFYIDADAKPYHFTHHDVTLVPRSELEHMRWLYLQGYQRAVILQVNTLGPSNIQIIHFKNQTPILPHAPLRTPTPWPHRLPTLHQIQEVYSPVYPSHEKVACSWSIGVEQPQINEFFASAEGILSRSFEGLDLPAHVTAALARCEPLERIDRLVIYADGSSLPEHRRRPPAQVEHEGNGDTWAFVVLGEQYIDSSSSKINLLGWTAQPVLYDASAKHFIGSQTVGSDTAEREAMFWCGSWRLAQNCNIPTTFCTDSWSTGCQADGTNGSCKSDESFFNLRAIFQGLEGCLPGCLDIKHVRGHSNDPWNDLVDVLAKHERACSFYHKRQTLDMQVWKDALKHLWTQVTVEIGLPRFNGQVFDVFPPELPAVDGSEAPISYQSRMANFCISLATANVNSLHTGPDGYGGKLQYIRDQMKALHLLFLGIQESRSSEVCSQSDDILRIGSGSEGGHHGVELWINLKQPFAYVGRKPHFLSKQHVVVVYADPRVLLVKLSHELWNAWILVAHGPHSGHPEDLRATWWSNLTDILTKFVGDSELFALVDANAEPGPTDAIHIGPRGTLPSKSTGLFREFLHTWALALPATFSCHMGLQNTWTAPDGLTQHCIDHVCVPCSRLCDCMFSRVVDEFDLGNSNWDHAVTATELTWKAIVSCQKRNRDTSISSVNREAICGQTVQGQLRQFVVPEWNQDIHSHVSMHNRHLKDCLKQACPPVIAGAKKSFITDDIWALRAQKLQCRKVGKDLQHRHRAELLRAAWCGWSAVTRGKDNACAQYAEVYQCYVTALLCWRLHHGIQLHMLASQLKKQLKWARRSAIQKDLQSMPEGTDASEILQMLKKHIGSTNLKSLKKPVLPMLRTIDGHQCISPTQLCDAWVDFFGQMEGGERMSWQNLTHKWRDSLATFQQQQVQLGPNDLPSLTDLEVAFRRVRRGKAVGQDAIPPELCRACPTVLAKQYYSALMKLMVHGQESLHHKGGILVPAFKGKGSSLDPSSYRSLLISSHMGKVLHRTVRQHQAQLYETFLCAQQFGGRRRVPVNLGLHEARAFLRSRQCQGLSVGLLMVDLTEAFYRVLRPLAVGGHYTDHQIAQIVDKLGMPPETLQDLLAHLQEPSAIEQAELPEHLQRVLRSLHTDTYFQVHGQTDCCHTSVGSRPGDCFADVVFSYLFARVMKCFQSKLSQAGLQEVIHDAKIFDPYANGEADGHQTHYTGPIWMDDLCVGISATTPAELLRKAGATTSLLLETLVGFGMTPNLKKGKTELLLSLRGKGVRKIKQQLFGPSSAGSIPIVCEANTQHVSVVGQYQHLGGLLHHGGDHRQEMKRRIAIAHTAFNLHRKVIYQNGEISKGKRVQLFNTLIVSKLVYGCESWVLRDQKSKEQLHAAIMRLYRRLLGCKPDDRRTDLWVLKELNLPTPTELLRQARLRYLGTLHACQDVVTWDILNADTEWCELIKDDLHWMWQQLANSSALQPPDQSFASWRYLWIHHRPYWKGLIKRAIQHAVLQRHNEWVVQHGHQEYSGATL